MRWNPFLSKRGRIAAAVAILILLPTGYLVSYPVAYRMLVGSDANRENSVPVVSGRYLCDPSPESARQRYQLWLNLRQYWFSPVEWMIDNTPARHPLFAFAYTIDTDEQMESDRLVRAILRGDRQAIQEWNRKLSLRSPKNP